MPIYTIKDLYDLSKTIAAPLFSGCTYPWEILDKIEGYILQLGPTLPADKFDNPQPGIWIAKSASVAPSASVNGPCIIDENAEIRHGAFIRGSAIVGKKAVVGNSTEVKNALLFDNVQVPHFNYVGDSVLGFKAHLGAGVITTNVKSDQTLITIKADEQEIETGRKKIGLMAGDYAEVGCNTALAPGCILGRHTTVYPTSFVRGQLAENSIYKDAHNITLRQNPN